LRRLAPLLALLVAVPARADPPIRLRMAAIAPEGTPWAREFHALARDVQESTDGQVELRWYLGGIAGDEFAALERTRRGQLDGDAGALFCERLAPSLRVGRVVGIFRNRDEWRYVMSRMLGELDREFVRSGFVNLGISTFGNILLFTRQPIHTLDDLRRVRLWSYDLDAVMNSMLAQMGATLVPLPVDQASKAWDEGRVDGFVATPSAALAFQWSARAHYVSDLTIGTLPGCFVIAQRSWDALSNEHRAAVASAVARFVGRFDELGRIQDDALLVLFERQGLRRTVSDDLLRTAFFEAARAAREKLSPSLVPTQLLSRTMGWLADYRAEHTR
jgi:TRAP-type transport system periplasmic protein